MYPSVVTGTSISFWASLLKSNLTLIWAWSLDAKLTPSGIFNTVDTKTIKVTINGPEDSVNSIDLSKFKCTVDISKLTADGGSIKPKISNSYDNIKVVSTNPTEVKVTFKKNTDSTENTENNSSKPSDNSNNNNASNGSNNQNSNNKQ